MNAAPSFKKLLGDGSTRTGFVVDHVEERTVRRPAISGLSSPVGIRIYTL